MTISLFGTFEVENYGDRLFPLIAEKELSRRLPQWKIRLYSPLHEDMQSEIHPIINEEGEVFPDNGYPDAVVVGGGDIISFATEIASIYREKWKNPFSPHTACWALPSIYRKSGAPLIWNANGVPAEFSEEQMVIVKQLTSEMDYISVRDRISLERLRKAGVTQEIAVVPDTALILPRLYAKYALVPAANKIFDCFGVAVGDSLVVQLHPYSINENVERFTEMLAQLKKLTNRPVVLLPIGYCHGDQHVLEKIYHTSKGEFHFIADKLEIDEIAAVIAHAGAFLGTSLHGNITAFAYGVPFLIYSCAGLSKLEGFGKLIDEEDRVCFKMEQILEKWEFLKRAPSRENYTRACEEIDNHFDRMAKTISSISPYQQNDDFRSLLMNFLILSHKKDQLAHMLLENEHAAKIKDEEINILKERLIKPPFFRRVVNKIKSLF